MSTGKNPLGTGLQSYSMALSATSQAPKPQWLASASSLGGAENRWPWHKLHNQRPGAANNPTKYPVMARASLRRQSPLANTRYRAPAPHDSRNLYPRQQPLAPRLAAKQHDPSRLIERIRSLGRRRAPRWVSDSRYSTMPPVRAQRPPKVLLPVGKPQRRAHHGSQQSRQRPCQANLPHAFAAVTPNACQRNILPQGPGEKDRHLRRQARAAECR